MQQDRLVPFDQHELTEIAEATDEMLAALHPMYNDIKEDGNYENFVKNVPLQDYESMKPLIEQIRKGKQNLLWPTEIKWFAKSSGTTTDKSKFIPVSIECLKECHYKGGKDMLSLYCNQVEKTHVFTGKTIMMGGSSQMNVMGNDQSSKGVVFFSLFQDERVLVILLFFIIAV